MSYRYGKKFKQSIEDCETAVIVLSKQVPVRDGDTFQVIYTNHVKELYGMLNTNVATRFIDVVSTNGDLRSINIDNISYIDYI